MMMTMNITIINMMNEYNNIIIIHEFSYPYLLPFSSTTFNLCGVYVYTVVIFTKIDKTMGAGSAVHSLRQRVASACLEFLGTNEISILQNDCWSSLSTSTHLFNQSPTLRFSNNESPFFLTAVFKICCRSNEFRELNTLKPSQLECCSVLIDAIKQDIPHTPILQKRFYTETLLLRNHSELTNITAVTHLNEWLETEVRSSHASAAMNIHDSELESCLNIFD